MSALPAACMPVTTARRNVIVVGLVLSMLVAALNQTSVAAVLPAIIADLDGLDSYAWVFTASMLAATVTAPIVGRLSDMHGRRPYFLGGIVIFLGGAVGCGLAESMAVLIAARAVQGVGMGVLMTLSLTVVADVVPAASRGRLQGLLAVVFGVATVLGPVGGGWLAGAYGWRSIFFVNLPLGALALAAVWAALRVPERRQAHSVDWAGAMLLTGATTCALVALTWGGVEYPWGSARVSGLLAAATVLAAAFVLVERRAEQPLVPLALLYRGTFARASLAALLSGMAMFGTVLFVPMHMQGVLGIDVDSAGAALVPFIVAFAATGGLSGLALGRGVSASALVTAGAALAAAGCVALARLTPASTPADVYIGLAIVGAGLGAVIPTLVNVAQQTVPPAHMGVGTAVHQFVRSFGGTVGVAIMGAVVNNTLVDNLLAQVPRRLRRWVPDFTFEDLRNGADRFVGEEIGIVDGAVLEAVRTGLNDSLVLVFAACVPLLVATAVVGWTLGRGRG